MTFSPLTCSRRSLGLLLFQAAHLIGVRIETLLAWEKGRRIPTPANRRKIKTLLGAQIEWRNGQ